MGTQGGVTHRFFYSCIFRWSIATAKDVGMISISGRYIL